MVRIGILGAGRVVQQRYTEVFRDELKDARIIAVCDRVQQRADQVATALGADAVYDGDDLLVRPDLDAILVATESGKHFRHARTVLAAGKHVIVEKPPALIPDEISAAVDLAKKKGLMYAVIFQNRLNPAMEILKETFLQGRFGEMVLATIRLRWFRYQEYYEDGWHGTWAMDGGVINQLEAEDTTAAVVKFENGALGVIEATTAARPEDFEASISIVGEEGMAVIGGIALNQIDTWQFVRPIEDDLVIPERCSQNVPTGYGLSHGPLMQEIVDRLNQGRIEPPITGADVVPTVRLVHAIYKSQETNGWTRLSDQPLSMRLGAG
jgi:predicted dehydrogenase